MSRFKGGRNNSITKSIVEKSHERHTSIKENPLNGIIVGVETINL